MSIARFLIVPKSLAVVLVASFGTCQDKQLPAKAQPSKLEIKKLIGELGAKEFKVRENATSVLKKSGAGVLDELEAAEEKATDVETQQRLAMVIKEIRLAERLPTKVKGMEFKLIAAIPKVKADKQTEFKIYLQITNMSEKIYRLFLDYTIEVVVKKNRKGEPLPLKVETFGDFREPVVRVVKPKLSTQTSAPLKKNESLKIPLSCTLGVTADDEPYFTCSDSISRTVWMCGPIRPENHYLAVAYTNLQAANDGLEPCWIGRAETLDEVIPVPKR